MMNISTRSILFLLFVLLLSAAAPLVILRVAAEQLVETGRSANRATCQFKCPRYDQITSKGSMSKVDQTVRGRRYCSAEEAARMLDFVFAFEDASGIRDELKTHLQEKHQSFDFATPDGKPVMVFSGGFGTGKSRMAEIASTLFSYRYRADGRAGDAMVDFKCATHQAKSPQAVRRAFIQKLNEVAGAVGTALPFMILLDDFHTLSAEQVEVALKPLFDRDHYYGEDAPPAHINQMLPRSFVVATVDFGSAVETVTASSRRKDAKYASKGKDEEEGPKKQKKRPLTLDELRKRTHLLLKERYGSFVSSRIAVYPMPAFGYLGHRRALQYKLYTLPCADLRRDKIRCFYWTERAEEYLIQQCMRASPLDPLDAEATDINGRLTENVYRREVPQKLQRRLDQFERGVRRKDRLDPRSVRPGQEFADEYIPGTDAARDSLLVQMRAARRAVEMDKLKHRDIWSFLSDLFSGAKRAVVRRDRSDVVMYFNESSAQLDFLVGHDLLNCEGK